MEAIRINDRLEWFIGPRRLRRTGRVLDVLPNGAFRVFADGMKTTPVRTVLATANPRKVN